jgi:Zn-dependent protease with chaperone function
VEIPADVLADARAQVPAWIRWTLPGVWLVLVAACAYAGTLVAIAIPLWRFRRSAGEHWTERARRAWPIYHAAVGTLTIACVLGVGATWMLGGPLALVPGRVLALLSIVAASTGVSWSLRTVRRWLPRDSSLRSAVPGSRLVWWLLVRIWFLVPGLVAVLIPFAWGPRTFVTLAAGIVGMAWFVHGGASRLLEIAGLSQEVSPDVPAIVRESAERASTPTPRTRILEVGVANALVVPGDRSLFLTRPLLEILGPAELGAIVDHEIAHLREPAWFRRARRAPLYLLALLPAAIPIGAEQGPLPALVLLALYPLVLLALGRGARRMEERADHAAHEYEPAAFARALEKIHQHNLVPAVLFGRGSTHPHLYDRMLAAGIQPDYERPRPPPRSSGVPGFVLGVMLAVAPGFAVMAVSAWSSSRVQAGEDAHLIALAVSHGDPWIATSWARLLQERGELEAAHALARYACAAEPADLDYACELVFLLQTRQMREEARAELRAIECAVRGEVATDPLPAAWLARACSDLGMHAEARFWIAKARRTADVIGSRSELDARLHELGIDGL